jgi:hypothetical protein
MQMSKMTAMVPCLRVTPEFAKRVKEVERVLKMQGIDIPDLRRQAWLSAIEIIERGSLPRLPIRILAQDETVIQYRTRKK